MKKIPTPFERISLTVCSILSSNCLGALLNSKCASSKKKTIFGLSKSPTSGNFSSNSSNIHSKKVAYNKGCLNNSSHSMIFIIPKPPSWLIQSSIFKAGMPKKISPPCSSSSNNLR